MIIIDDDGVMHKVFTKADMVAMLEDLRLEIEKIDPIEFCNYRGGWCFSRDTILLVIQTKINALKENRGNE